MMRKELNIVFLVIFVPAFLSSVWAEKKDTKKEGTPVLQRITENSSVYTSFFSLPYNNPVMKYRMYDYTLNEVSVGGDYRNESLPIVVQMGDGFRYGFVDVNSFINKRKSSMWGKASYRNGIQKNVKWNETSDYLLLYPYVMGDTLGGDFKSERYYFGGGYTAESGRFIWGVDASYSATLGYRQVDPRPRNVTGELDFTLGAALTEVGYYRVGLSVNAFKYKQKNDIKFYNEQGNVTLYHFTGMGLDYYRFRGEKKETYYKGHRFGGSLNLLPETKSGFTVNVSFDNFRFEKIISSLNELPMAKVDEYTWKAEVGYKQKNDNRFWGMKTNVSNNHRKGTENLFGDPANDIYPLIASAQQYSSKQAEYTLSGFYESGASANFGWAVCPNVGFHQVSVRYIYPMRTLDNDRLNSSAMVRIWKQIRRALLRVDGQVRYSASLNSQLQLSDIVDKKTLTPLYCNYRFLSTDYIFLQLALRSDIAINRRCALYVTAYWQRGWYTDKVYTDGISAVIGVAF